MTEGTMLMFHNSDEMDVCFIRGQGGDSLETMEKEGRTEEADPEFSECQT